MRKIIVLFFIFYISICYYSFSGNRRLDSVAGNIMARNGEPKEGIEEISENIDDIFNSNNVVLHKPTHDDYYNVFNSFMFNKKNLSIIKKAILIYDNKITNRNLASSEINGEINYDESMSRVYLKSILYISKNQWVVWINNHKISNDSNKNDGEFIVKNLNSSEAVILWTIEKNKWDLINAEKKIPDSNYSINNDKIEFKIKLHPNQTFLATENKIIDGKYKQENMTGINSAESDIKQILGNDENFDLESLLN